jgi:hypothetical protein
MLTPELVLLVCPLVLSFWFGFGLGLEDTGQPVREQGSQLLVEREYDLLPRLKKGHESYYSYVDRFGHIGSAGKEERSERVTGYFRQKVIDIRPGGAPVFRAVRNHTQLTTAAAGEAPIGPVALDFGEGLTYEVCFEDNFDYLPIDTSRLPNSLPGFMMFENIVHSHTFAILATRTHGALEKLKRVGTTVVIPDSGKGGRVSFPGLLTIELVRGESKMTFLGLSEHQGEPAALLSYDIPLTFPEVSSGTGKGTGTARATGLIWLSLSRGEILRAHLRQTTNLSIRATDGTVVPSYVEAEGWLEKIPPHAYPVATK